MKRYLSWPTRYVLRGLDGQNWQNRSRGLAERVMVLLFILMRLAVLAQCVVIIPEQLRTCRSPALLLAGLAVVLTSSALATALAFRHGTVRGLRVGLCDVAPSVVCVPLILWALGPHAVTTPAGLAIGGYIFNVTAVSAAWPTTIKGSLRAPATIAVVFAAEVFWAGAPSIGWLLTNALGEVTFGLAVTLFAWIWRNLADRVDFQTERAEVAERELERQHFLNAAHDVSGLLRYLAAHLDDPLDRATLKRVALSEATRWRTFAHADAGLIRSDDVSESLASVIESAADDFPGLRVMASTELCDGAEVTSKDATYVRMALSALLGNVRTHAKTDHATVHGKALPRGGWVITVADEGKGFDPKTVVPGYGLAVQTRAHLNKINVTTDVVSSPGLGTTVTLTKEIS